MRKILLWNVREKITQTDFLLQFLSSITLFILWIFVKFNYLSVKLRNSFTWVWGPAHLECFPSSLENSGKHGKDCTRNHSAITFCAKHFGSCRSQCSSAKLCSPLAPPLLVNKVFVLGKVCKFKSFLVIIQAQDNERNSKMDNWLIRERELDEVWSKWLINKCFGLDRNYSE